MRENTEGTDTRDTRAVARRDRGRLATTFGSLVGLGGTLVCSLSMLAAAVGLFAAGGAAAAQGGMAGMDSMDQGDAASRAAHVPGWLDVILRFGPAILIVSILLVVASVALRRPAAALPAIGGGIILYVGMYLQPNVPLMYTAIVVGTALLLLAYAASLRPVRREA